MLSCCFGLQVDGRDLLPEEVLDAEIPEDELFARAVLASEIMAADVQNAEQAAAMADEEETAIGRNYALTEISATLKKQIDELSVWRTEVNHCCYWFASAVTFALFRCCAPVVLGKEWQTSLWTPTRRHCSGIIGQCNRMLFSWCFISACAAVRFLGWVNSQPGSVGALDCSLFGAEAAQELVENFVHWCQHERQLSFGTIGTYLNSLLSCANFAHASRICDVEDSLLQAMYNLRLQADAQSREDRKWKRPHPAWISWGELLCSDVLVIV